MWHKAYRDYKTDEPIQKQTVEPKRGIVGCEMHEIFGWGNELHIPPAKKKGFIRTLLEALLNKFTNYKD